MRASIFYAEIAAAEKEDAVAVMIDRCRHYHLPPGIKCTVAASADGADAGVANISSHVVASRISRGDVISRATCRAQAALDFSTHSRQARRFRRHFARSIHECQYGESRGMAVNRRFISLDIRCRVYFPVRDSLSISPRRHLKARLRHACHARNVTTSCRTSATEY